MDISIAIIDQNEIFRESLKTLLEQIPGFRVVLSSGDLTSLSGFHNIPINVMLLENSFGKENCPVQAGEAEAQTESIRILILAMYKEELGLDFGRAATILKSSSKNEFEKRIRGLSSSQDNEMNKNN